MRTIVYLIDEVNKRGPPSNAIWVRAGLCLLVFLLLRSDHIVLNGDRLAAALLAGVWAALWMGVSTQRIGNPRLGNPGYPSTSTSRTAYIFSPD